MVNIAMYNFGNAYTLDIASCDIESNTFEKSRKHKDNGLRLFLCW